MANVISQYWSEGTPTQMELFDDADKDFETMKRKIKGHLATYSIDASSCHPEKVIFFTCRKGLDYFLKCVPNN